MAGDPKKKDVAPSTEKPKEKSLKSSQSASKGQQPTPQPSPPPLPPSQDKGKGVESSSGKELAVVPELDYDPNLFLSKKTSDEYTKTWEHKPITIERACNLALFLEKDPEEYSWATKIIKQGWEDVFAYEGKGITTLCGEFMANIRSSSTDEPGKQMISSFVRGAPITVMPHTFSNYFGIEKRVANPRFRWRTRGMPEWLVVSKEILAEGDVWPERRKPAPEEHDEDEVPVSVLGHLLHDHANQNDCGMSQHRAALIYAIAKGMTIDLLLYMFSHLFEAWKDLFNYGSILYGCMLTQLFEDSVSIMTSYARTESLGAINPITIETGIGAIQEDEV